jgi:hypothetical protein
VFSTGCNPVCVTGLQFGGNHGATILSAADCSESGGQYVDIGQDADALLHGLRLSVPAWLHHDMSLTKHGILISIFSCVL